MINPLAFRTLMVAVMLLALALLCVSRGATRAAWWLAILGLIAAMSTTLFR